MAKLSKTAQWMLDHPDDIPPPKSGGGARAWRIARGLDGEWGRFKRDQRALAKANREKRMGNISGTNTPRRQRDGLAVIETFD